MDMRFVGEPRHAAGTDAIEAERLAAGHAVTAVATCEALHDPGELIIRRNTADVFRHPANHLSYDVGDASETRPDRP